MYKRLSIFILLLLLTKSVSMAQNISQDWSTYRSPAGFYSLNYPSDWKIALTDNIVNITPPDESGAVTISAYYGEEPIPNFMSTWLSDTFSNEIPLSEKKPITKNECSGFHQEFRSSGDNPRINWLAIVCSKDKVFVLITANDQEKTMAKRKLIYEAIFDSLKIEKPQD